MVVVSVTIAVKTVAVELRDIDHNPVTTNTWVAGIMVVLALISAVYSVTKTRNAVSSLS